MRPTKVPRVALLIESSNAYARGLLTGISEYIQERGAWTVYFHETGRGIEGVAERLRGWDGDGVILRAEDEQTARAVAECRCPIVNVSAAGLLPDVPAFHSDVRAEAEAAFDHLWERGFRNLAYCGVSDYRWSAWQHTRFKELAMAHGMTVASHIVPLNTQRPRGWSEDRQKLIDWLKSLPKPVGVFACYDLRGQHVLDGCREANLDVPDQVAVIGVDNDPVFCNLCNPPLSSVAPDARRVGYLAAEWLSQMMAGRTVEPGLRLVPPISVVARRSTDSLAIDDPDVSAALRFIRAHACEPIGVKQVLQAVPLTRRALEGRFLRLLKRTPHEQILHCRVDRAKQLLCDTDLPIKAIAPLVGAGTPEYLSVLFNRMLGISPSAFRQRHQAMRARGESVNPQDDMFEGVEPAAIAPRAK
ncbi:MAG: XylR family transcriptional regulator [Tepidisphaeraceae bacterium]